MLSAGTTGPFWFILAVIFEVGIVGMLLIRTPVLSVFKAGLESLKSGACVDGRRWRSSF